MTHANSMNMSEYLMRQILIAIALLVCLALGAAPVPCRAADGGWKAVGIRAGFSASEKRDTFFHQYEAFTTYGLPWSLRSESGWGVALQLNAALGAVHGSGKTGIIGSFGPGVVFDKSGRGLALDLGGDINVLSRRRYGNMDLNGNPLWEGHLGMAYRFMSGLGLSYRFQHMSNGGLALHGDENPGLDLHLFGVSSNF
jgi:hypothetical protein